MTEFEINEEFITDLRVAFKWTEDGKEYGTLSHKDHPSFAALREHLGARGYIQIERGWLNGDRVTKEFKLNGKLFKVGDQFSSSGAMSFEFKRLREDGNNLRM